MGSTKNILIHKILVRTSLILLSSILYACGGGGGSGSNGNSIPTYYTWQNYYAASDLASLLNVYSNFSDNNRAYHFRGSSSNILCSSRSENATIKINPESSNQVSFEIKFDPLTGTGDCTGANISGDALKFSSDEVNTPYYSDMSGFYNGSLERLKDWDIGIRDINTLQETVFQVNSLLNETDGVTSYWSGTSYVLPDVSAINYGDTCRYSSGACLEVDADSTYNSDIIASVSGDLTESSDMPSGTKSYTSKGLSVGMFGLANFLNRGESTSFISGCGYTNSVINDWNCHIKFPFSVSGAHVLVADFSAKTLTGNFTLSNHFILESSQTDITGIFPISTVTDLDINATISGNSFSGTVSNTDFEGNIKGNFYGPKGAEIGATILIEGKNSSIVFPLSNRAYASIALVGY